MFFSLWISNVCSSVSNRGKYVKVNMKNIEEGKEHNFQKYNSSFVTNFNMEYDFGSIIVEVKYNIAMGNGVDKTFCAM